jgi:3-hydroxyacyl-CoA dehydrogenase
MRDETMPVMVRFGHATVLGAGTMGAQIAAHLANAGLQVQLLDVSEEAARQGLNRARQLRPDPFFAPDRASFIRVGSLEALDRGLSSSDWIIEAVVENLEVKRGLLARVDQHRAPHAIVSSNTSGILLAALAEGRSEGFRRHWLGTHFFNPPRYLRLVEVIPTADTDPGVTQGVAAFIDHQLGKGVVIAKDTPAFIANRIGLFGVVRLLEALAAGGYTIEEIDAVTGPAIGRPKSASFRTIDIAGLDILAHVARDLSLRLPTDEDRRGFELPPFVDAMIDRGLLGEKAGQGFYKRVKDGSETTILALDLAALTYVSQRRPHLPELDAAGFIHDTGERLRALFLGHDKVGTLLRQTLGPTLLYAARVAPEIAYSIDDVDRAMRWGFGWDLGPFETLDAIGPRAVSDACQGVLTLPDRFREAPLPPARPDLLILRSARQRSRVVKTNPGASLVDLGDGVLCVEFHSKMNAIGGDTLAMLHAGVHEAAANFAALVVGSEAEHFSAGANLMLLLLEAQEGNWDEIDLMVRAFQGATMALRESPVPVVAAPGGLALGGGCEICLHADRVQSAAETYIGLVEVGVGLIPAGGGTKEMLLRTAGDTAAVPRVFEAIGFAKVSTSGLDARQYRYLRDVDGITMNRERLIADAKAVALARARDGYQPPPRRTDVPVGGADTLAALSLGVHLAWRAGRISDHDALLGRKLAWILAGGDLPHRAMVSEDYLLDLEREAFLSLCGQPKTLERIGYTLKTGKTLRN